MAYPRFGRRVVRFPFGYTVVIREVIQSEINRRADGAIGLWQPSETGGTILLSKAQDYDTKFDTLQHELAHAVVDYGGWLQSMFAEPFRAERMLQIAQDVEEANE